MAYAVDLRLDRRASDAVMGLWAALDRAGETSLARSPGRHAVPLQGALTPALGLELTLGSLGFFVGPTTVAFLGVAPTHALLEAHRSLLGALAPGTAGLWEHYRVDALVPHCTLAMAVRDPGVVASAVGDRLPIAARVAAAALVDVPTGRPLIEIGGPP